MQFISNTVKLLGKEMYCSNEVECNSSSPYSIAKKEEVVVSQGTQSISIWDIRNKSNIEKLEIARNRAISGDEESIEYLALESFSQTERMEYAKKGADKEIPECLIEYGFYCEKISLNEKALYSYNRAGELGYVEGSILKALLLIKGDDNQLADGINTLLSVDPEKDLAWGYQIKLILFMS
jgi:hypothetical protein